MTPASLLVVLFLLVAIVVLLVNDKTRKGTLVFFGVFAGLAAGLAALAILWWMPVRHVSVGGVSGPVVERRAKALPPTISKAMAEAPQPRVGEGGKAPPTAEKRPAWVDSPPGRQGDAYRTTAVTDPYTTRAECDARVPEALQKALAEYAELYLGGQAPPASAFPAEDLERAIVKDRFEETIHSPSVGPMIQLHLLLEFDRAVRERIQKAAERAVIDRRLWRTGTCALAALGLLAVALAYLKADLATGGAHRRRLRLGAWLAAAIVLLACWISFRVG
jgi:hypothetical protein